jgi:hypothetical protein
VSPCGDRQQGEDQIAGITKENYHREADWGGPVGNEVW